MSADEKKPDKKFTPRIIWETDSEPISIVGTTKSGGNSLPRPKPTEKKTGS